MKQINDNQTIRNNKNGKFDQIIKIIITPNIICGIVTVKLNHNITANLPIELVCEIVSFTYKFQHQLKFQPVL